ncbi:helix-turn-helix domain-containing protein [Oleidesulfovibrio sp.]|uniref:helix-turn-helix domain-containing protein n=1 Tax=Oleidesulfovibrio sp. TaxID=2909707 RepID=UPI003A8471A2
MPRTMEEKHKEWSNDPEYIEAFDALEQEFAIARALIKARREAGMTQAEVAKRMGISQPAVARIEAGKNVSVKTLGKYARAIGRSIDVRVLPA